VLEGIANNLENVRSIFEYIRAVQADYPDDENLVVCLTRSYAVLINEEAKVSNTDTAIELLQHLNNEIRAAYPGNEFVRASTVSGAALLASTLIEQGKSEHAQEILDFLRGMHENFDEDATIASVLATTAKALIRHEGALGHIDSAGGAFLYITQLLLKFPMEEGVWDAASHSGMELCGHALRANDLPKGLVCFEFLRHMLPAMSGHETWRACTAVAAKTVLIYSGEGQALERQRDLMAFVRDLQAEFPFDSAVLDSAVKCAVGLILAESAAGNFDEVAKLNAYGETLAAEFPHDSGVGMIMLVAQQELAGE
jgi:hypothetical protein